MISHQSSSKSNKTDLNKFDNQWYHPQASILKRLIWYFINALFFRSAINPSSALKVFFLRLFGAKVGKKLNIKPCVNIKYPWLLEIGNFCWIGEDVWIDNLAKVVLKDHVCISQGALLLTGNHNYKKSSFDLLIGEITLEAGVWIGAKSTVCPGVTCKNHSILSVGSVAIADLEPFSIYQGNPAIKKRKRNIIE